MVELDQPDEQNNPDQPISLVSPFPPVSLTPLPRIPLYPPPLARLTRLARPVYLARP